MKTIFAFAFSALVMATIGCAHKQPAKTDTPATQPAATEPAPAQPAPQAEPQVGPPN